MIQPKQAVDVRLARHRPIVRAPATSVMLPPVDSCARPVSASGDLVSVFVLARNAQRTLLETLQSAAAQTQRDLEILIVDDGSTDSTPDIAAQFCMGDGRSRLTQKANEGVAPAQRGNRGGGGRMDRTA